MKNAARKQARHVGLGLVEVLVVLALLVVLAAFLYPRLTGSGRNAAGRKVMAPKERAQQAVGVSYIGQINQAIALYRMDNDGRNPPNLTALKRYGVTGEMLRDPVTKQPLAYDPRTGKVGAPGGTGGGTAPAGVPGL
jgi:type II secretory pathway pseudopilin PulG